jgi:hypothetical protein
MSTQLYGMQRLDEKSTDRVPAPGLASGSWVADLPGLPFCAPLGPINGLGARRKRLDQAVPLLGPRNRSGVGLPVEGASPASAGECGDAGSTLHVRCQETAAQHRLVRPSGRLLHRSWTKNQGFPARSVRRPAGDRDLQPLLRAHAMQRPCPRVRRARGLTGRAG